MQYLVADSRAAGFASAEEDSDFIENTVIPTLDQII